MSIKEFLEDAFEDMKEDARTQHEVDKANFEAAKLEAKADFEEKKAKSSLDAQKAERKAQHEADLAAAQARVDAAKARLK